MSALIAAMALTFSHCAFADSHGAFTGTCPIADETPRFTVAKRISVEGGAWRSDATPDIVYGGTMADEDSDRSPAQLQIFAGGSGILQTVDGWFPVRNYGAAMNTIFFDVDGQHEVPPNDLDVKIIARAAEILSSEAVWNRDDDRECTPNATTYSIYCAGEKAVEEITGGTGPIDHRRPAMEVIRGIVDDRAAKRNYKHRLMDYNNDPATTIDDVRSVFQDALRRASDPTWLSRHGFAS